MKSLSEDWVEVYHGAPAVAELVHARLHSEGVRTFVPDRNLRWLDPTDTGGSVFELRVLVAREDVARARALLASDAAAGADLEASPPEELERRTREAQRLGERLIVAAAMIVLAPLALWWAPRYFRLVRELPTRPRRYRVVQAATRLAVFLLAAGVALLVLTPW